MLKKLAFLFLVFSLSGCMHPGQVSDTSSPDVSPEIQSKEGVSEQAESGNVTNETASGTEKGVEKEVSQATVERIKQEGEDNEQESMSSREDQKGNEGDSVLEELPGDFLEIEPETVMTEQPLKEVGADQEEKEKKKPFEQVSDIRATLEIFEDYQCPYCKRFEKEVIFVLREKYPNVEIIFRHFPLPFHVNARTASKFAICAGEQGKFVQMSDRLFEESTLAEENLLIIAGELELNINQLKTCVKAEETNAKIEADIALGKKNKITGTPTFFLNGEMYEGYFPLENVEKYLRELKN